MTTKSLVFVLIRGAALASGAAAANNTEIIPNREVPAGVREAAQKMRAKEDETPAALRWMIKPIKRGMFVRIPVIDTDPNRGVTFGIMPIVVLQGKDDDRIKQIHAPSITYNKDFRLTPTYRYYYYPQEDANFHGRASRGKFEHEVMAQYMDESIFGSPYNVFLHVHKNRDAGQRFFGFGPDSPQSGEANYIQDSWQYQWRVGVPINLDASLRAHLSQRYVASRVLNGPLKGLPLFEQIHPRQFSSRTQQTNETRVSLGYDTRDHSVTTARGAYAEVYAESSLRGYLSGYDYRRCGADARWFRPWASDSGHVLAIQGRYDQLLGPTPPFWILPAIGGKYSLRAYGDGRYIDRGAATLNVEQRLKLYEARTAGVTTELQLAPFAGVGTVFDAPQAVALKYLRPVVGAAVRAVARPQVVGSVDFGVGREGLSVFTDINYSF